MAIGDHDKVLRNPRFQELVRQRSSFAWSLSIAMLVIYFGFILLVAFAKGLLATKIGAGVTSLGILIGLAVIVAAFVLTGIYVQRANSRFDEMTRKPYEGFDVMSRTLTVAGTGLAAVAARHRHPCGRAGCRRRSTAGAQLDGDPDVPPFRADDARHHLSGRHADTVRRRLLRRGRRHYGIPERPCNRRRLHVGRVVPRHLGSCLLLRLRRSHLLDRLPRRLADRALPHRRAPAQSGQLHVRRRRLVSSRSDPDPDSVGDRNPRRRGLLPHRPDGRRRAS